MPIVFLHHRAGAIRLPFWNYKVITPILKVLKKAQHLSHHLCHSTHLGTWPKTTPGTDIESTLHIILTARAFGVNLSWGIFGEKLSLGLSR